MIMKASPEDDKNSRQSKSANMKDLSRRAATARAQISTQNVQESLTANVRIDEEALQAGITKLLPLSDDHYDSSTSRINAICCS